MKRIVPAFSVAAVVVLAGCAGPDAGTDAGTDAGPDAGSGPPWQGSAESLPGTSTAPAAEPEEVPEVPLRAYTSRQLAAALRTLSDPGGNSPVHVMTDEDAAVQGPAGQSVQQISATPADCARYVNFSPSANPGFAMGMAFFAAAGGQSSVGAVVDAGGGNPGRMADSREGLDRCGSFTLSLAGQSIAMTLKEVPVRTEAEDAVAVVASGSVQGAELNVLNVSGYRGSVLVSGTAVLQPGTNPDAATDELAGYAEDVFTVLAELPGPEAG